MTAIIDQQIEFQNKQAAHSNLRCGPVDRRQHKTICVGGGCTVIQAIELLRSQPVGTIVRHGDENRSGIDRRSIVSTLERATLMGRM